MRVAMLAPIAWRTPPRHYGPWELVTSLLTEELVRRGVDVTLFATADSITTARLRSVCPAGYEETAESEPKVMECLHIAACFEAAREFDLIHNQFDFLPLTYSGLVDTPLVTTIHGFSSPAILPVYRKYNGRCRYVSISDADRAPGLDYIATVYHGIDPTRFTFRQSHDNYLLFFGRIHPDKGTTEAIEIARMAGRRLVIAGIIQDRAYYDDKVAPRIDGDRVRFVGSAGPTERDRLLGGAEALLHPIGFAEPFGLSVVESMACGTPVIAYRKGSMEELIDDGVDGFLVDSAEQAARAVAKVDGLDRAACRHKVVRRFTVERMAGDYMNVYKRILDI